MNSRLSQQISGTTGDQVNQNITAENARINGEVASQAAGNLTAREAVRQTQANADLDALFAANRNAATDLAIRSSQRRASLNAQATTLGRNTFETLQRVNNTLNTPFNQRQSFIDGAARSGLNINPNFADRSADDLIRADRPTDNTGIGPIEVPQSVGNTLGAASRFEQVGQRIGTTTRTSVQLTQAFDEFGQVLNSRARNATSQLALNFDPLRPLSSASSSFAATELPSSSIFGPGGGELIRFHNSELTSNVSGRLLDESSSVFRFAQRLGQVGDVLEFGSDTFNNFNQDGLSPRAFIALGLDAFELVLSGSVSTVAGTFVGGLAGTGTAATVVGAPAAPAVAIGTGVATGVAVDSVIDRVYADYLREPTINGLLSIYEFGSDIYDSFTN